MARKPEKEIIKWLSLEELMKEIRNRKIEALVLRKLLFIKFLYEGKSVPEASAAVGINKVTGYKWLEEWNENGLEGLKPKYGGGRPPKLTKEQIEALKTILKTRDDWTTKEVRELIKDMFGIEYSLRHVSRILKSLGMKYGEPYQYDYRKPKNAEEEFKKT